MSNTARNDCDINNGNKKRKRKEKKEDIIKNKKARGLEHINHMNKLVPARKSGPDCRCKRFKCYTKIDTRQREMILMNFNDIGNKNEQDAYLLGLMSASPTARHTVNNPQRFRLSSFSYKIRIGLDETVVCLTAFCNIHGVTIGRTRRLQDLMATNIPSPRDQRGKHTENRAKKAPECILNLIRYHISSFPARQSRYSLRDNPNCYYLDEELSVTEMHKLFLSMYHINVSFMVYWSILKKEYKLKFGLPRTDTCAVCNSYNLSIKCAALPETVRILQTEHKLHLCKAEKFNEIKRTKRKSTARKMCMLEFRLHAKLTITTYKNRRCLLCKTALVLCIWHT
ncbi:uncharacterized protein LOC121736808 [Aricia agestis]|uniref:uncharacterized protein LOC121736808 n=1 Tax=Aricia agestis TaxID=91739 RepID=UPI001C203D23|nr:uncharacterized protein LOC121736808 [Aricia agestis]